MEKEKILSNKIGAITASESELNKLFKETLDGVRDDLNESQQNIDMYLVEITAQQNGKDLYGTLYNDALKIKGNARERQLKFLNMFKDRVAKKEEMDLRNLLKKEGGLGGELNHAELNKYLEEMKQEKNTNIPKIELQKNDGELEEEFDEDIQEEDDD